MVISNIFYFHPDPWGNDSQFDEHFFQLGWELNHHLDLDNDSQRGKGRCFFFFFFFGALNFFQEGTPLRNPLPFQPSARQIWWDQGMGLKLSHWDDSHYATVLRCHWEIHVSRDDFRHTFFGCEFHPLNRMIFLRFETFDLFA